MASKMQFARNEIDSVPPAPRARRTRSWPLSGRKMLRDHIGRLNRQIEDLEKFLQASEELQTQILFKFRTGQDIRETADILERGVLKPPRASSAMASKSRSVQSMLVDYDLASNAPRPVLGSEKKH
eukprot:GABV01009459.1.p2 GENE.GABV01009459.1~~GABV01009459.1.p2  ORF type:complete len:126 (+),score=42.45 GABV01009459.1:104-481(+)